MSNQKLTPIQSAFDIFLLDCEARRLTDSTIRTYRFRLGSFLSWCESQSLQNTQDVEPMHIRLYLVSMNKRELGDYTQRGAGIALKTFFKFCITEGWITQSPAANVRLQREPKRILPSLASSDIKKLLEASYTEYSWPQCQDHETLKIR